VPDASNFDPDRVQRITFRWTRAVGSSDILGPSVSPTGRYVFSSDYDHLLMMYHDLEKRLELRPDL